jgi:phospholipid/cholesterol/gamma-HCH transport system permease protein
VFLETRRTAQGVELLLTGPWRISHLDALERELAAVELAGTRQVLIDAAGLDSLDLSASLKLRDFLNRAGAAGATVEFTGGAPPDQLRLIAACAEAAPVVAPSGPQSYAYDFEEPVEALGRRVVGGWDDLLTGLTFVGRVAVTAAASLRSPRRLRPVSIARHVYDTGITAIPIVTLIAFLISVIVAYMSAQQLARFGAELFVVDLVTIGVLRELGVLLTAIIVAGRSGSAFAAELGSMNLNAEVDALQAMGVNPFEALVLPRVIGLTIALPLLTVIADAVGLTGGALLCRYLLGIPLPQYLIRMNEAIAPSTFWAGLAKAPVFGMLIAMAGTYRGMQVRGSSRELGRLTTVAVVQAIFVVLLADALFAVLFMALDI